MFCPELFEFRDGLFTLLAEPSDMRYADDLLGAIGVSDMEKSTVEAIVGDDEIAGFPARLLGLDLGTSGRAISVLAEAAFKVRRVLPFGRRHDFSLCPAMSP